MSRSPFHRLGGLPYTSRRGVGGGIAMTATALLAIALWAGGSALLLAVGLADSFGAGEGWGFLLVAAPAVPLTFLVGTALWRRYAPSLPSPRRGAALGAATALVSLLLSAVVGGALVFLPAVQSAVSGQPTTDAVTAGEFLFVVLLTVAYALAFAVWLVVPLGALGGWYHERSRRERPATAASRRTVE